MSQPRKSLFANEKTPIEQEPADYAARRRILNTACINIYPVRQEEFKQKKGEENLKKTVGCGQAERRGWGGGALGHLLKGRQLRPLTALEEQRPLDPGPCPVGVVRISYRPDCSGSTSPRRTKARPDSYFFSKENPNQVPSKLLENYSLALNYTFEYTYKLWKYINARMRNLNIFNELKYFKK